MHDGNYLHTSQETQALGVVGQRRDGSRAAHVFEPLQHHLDIRMQACTGGNYVLVIAGKRGRCKRQGVETSHGWVRYHMDMGKAW
ncbi:hypothetical protein D9M68_760080 [compost metagenome]